MRARLTHATAIAASALVVGTTDAVRASDPSEHGILHVTVGGLMAGGLAALAGFVAGAMIGRIAAPRRVLIPVCAVAAVGSLALHGAADDLFAWLVSGGATGLLAGALCQSFRSRFDECRFFLENLGIPPEDADPDR